MSEKGIKRDEEFCGSAGCSADSVRTACFQCRNVLRRCRTGTDVRSEGTESKGRGCQQNRNPAELESCKKCKRI